MFGGSLTKNPEYYDWPNWLLSVFNQRIYIQRQVRLGVAVLNKAKNKFA